MALGTVAQSRLSTQTSSAPPAFVVPRFGLAVFQNDANPSNGVAVVHGQRPRAFESRTSLPSDCLWISTAQQGEVAQNFRPKNFLRSSLEALADDLGVELRDVVDGMPRMAQMLEQISNLVALCYKWDDPRLAWSKSSLAEIVREAFPRMPDPEGGIIGPLKDALQSYSAVPDRIMVREHRNPVRQYTLRHNRLDYAQYLLSQPYPDLTSNWMWSELRDVQQALDLPYPCLVEVALEFDPPSEGQPDYSRLCAFGSSVPGRRGSGVMRRWVSQPELQWLAQHAHVHIKRSLVSTSGYVRLPKEFALPAPLCTDPLLTLSLAAGVVAEAHWVALTLPRLRKRDHSGASSRFEEVVTPLAVWLKAYDRAYGFFMAAQAAQMGYDVVGYGYGAVTVEADRNEPARLLELADRLGVCHPNLAALQSRIALGGLEPEVAA